MTYENFIEQLLAYRKFYRDTSKLYEMGFDFMEGKFKLTEPVDMMLKSCIKSHYGEQGWDWVSWFIYESDWGEKDWGKAPSYKKNQDGSYEQIKKSEEEEKYGAFDENGNPICYSYESLWEYLEKNFKNNINEN